VDEHFAVEKGNASLKSTSEDGTTKADGFYISNNGPAAESAVLVAALLKAKNGPLRLLPAGEARTGAVDGRDDSRSRAEDARDGIRDHGAFR